MKMPTTMQSAHNHRECHNLKTCPLLMADSTAQRIPLP